MITGDNDVMRAVRRDRGCGHWSAATHVLLEKHGVLDFDRAPHTVLDRADILRCYDLLIIGWLPRAFWKASYVQALRAFDGVVFVEGPVEFPLMHPFLGIEAAPGDVWASGDLCFAAEPWRDYLKSHFGRTLGLDAVKHDGDAVPTIRIAPKALTLAPVSPDRYRLAADVSVDDARGASRLIAEGAAVALRRRFETDERFFPNGTADALALLAWSESVERRIARPGDRAVLHHCAQYYARLASDSTWRDALEPESRVIYSVALAGIGLASGYQECLEASRYLAKPASGSAPAAARWHALGPAGASASESPAPLTREPSFADDAITLWIESRTAAGRQRLAPFVAALAERLEHEDVATLESVAVPNILLAAAVLCNTGHRSAGERLVAECLAEAWDSEKAAFRQAVIEAGRLTRGEGWVNHPTVLLALVDVVGQETDMRASDPATATQSAPDAWAVNPCWIGAYRCRGAEEISVFRGIEGDRPGLVRRGRVMSSTFPILSWLVHHHTMHPLEEPLFDCPMNDAMALETMLVAMLEALLADYGLAALRVHAWPWNKTYCITLRHDVDRIPDDAQLAQRLDLARREGLSASWFWIADRARPDQITAQASAGHEIALHAVSAEGKAREKRALEALLAGEGGIDGESWHVGGSDYWVGVPSIEAAAAADLSYTEFVPTVLDLPYARFPVMDADGSITEIDGLIGITQTASTDAIPGKTRKAAAISDISLVEERARNGGYVCLLNHPDMNGDRLSNWLARLPRAGRQSWSCREVSIWWRSTHHADRLRIRRIEDTQDRLAYKLAVAEAVQDLELRLSIDPRAVTSLVVEDGHGTRREPEWCHSPEIRALRIRLDLVPGEPTFLRIARRRRPRYREIYASVPDALRDSRAAQADYNLLRVTRMVEVIDRFTDLGSRPGALRWADVGCGFGQFTAALHAQEAMASTIGLDIFDRYVKTANGIVDATGLSGIQFIQTPMTDTAVHVADADVVVVNNAINFLTSPVEYKTACRSFLDALRPGGWVVVLTPSRWYWREAFTGLPLIQFLPRRLASLLVRRLGRRATYDDIRLPSPWELSRWLTGAGFENPVLIDPFNLRTGGWKRYLKPRWYIVARRPR